MGRQHLLEMQKAGMTPFAVAEVDASRLDVAKIDFPGIETYASVGEMLKKSNVELIVIITPHHTHAPIALQCLKAGRHVVCEKPLAITTAEVNAMIAAAKKSGVMLSTYHNRHWDGRIIDAVRRVKKEQCIGAITRIQCHMHHYGMPGEWWRSSRSISGGILYDWGVHLLEYSLQLIDSPITEVSGFSHEGFWAPQTHWKKDTNEDEASAIVRFKSGQWLHLSVSSIDAKGSDPWVEISGTRGNYSFGGEHYQLITSDGTTTRTEKGRHSADEGFQFYQNVARHLVKGEKLIITGEWSRRPIHILDLAGRSAKQGKSLATQYP